MAGQREITTKYGRQTHPTLGTPFISNGITLRIPETQEVQAVADGQILYAGQFMSYGSMVVLEHSGDWYSVYGRLSKWGGEKGQLIKKGEVVGWTGAAQGGGAEAYFELRFYGKPVDPLPWLVQQASVQQ